MKQYIFSYPAIETLKKNIREKFSVLVGGCFDIIHYGHTFFLREAKKAGDVVIVALESDEFIQNKKRRQPIHSQQQRAEMLLELKSVDYVILLPFFNSDAEYFELVELVSPSVIAVTADDPLLAKKRLQIEKIGGRLITVAPRLSAYSSSKIITYADFSWY